MLMVTIIAAALYSSLNAAFRGKRAAERAIGPIRAANVAMGIMELDIQATMIPSPQTLIPETTVLYLAGPFQGLASGGNSQGAFMSFYTVGTDQTPDVPLTEGVRRIEYALANDAGNPVLMRRIARNVLSGDVNVPPEEEEILLEDVRSFTIRYFDGIQWYDQWDSTAMVDVNGVPAIPMLVQMEVVIHIEGVAQTGEAAGDYRISKMIPLACAKPVDADATALLGTIQ